ncbi:MAG: DUF4382 domain-containing protein [Chloroflexi bacterium]|nr:DUF4382 domain-containing protein [Chloroflexota bacterium]
MNKKKFGRMLMLPLILVMAVAVVAITACTPEELEVLSGVLQKVDSADGKITIVTKDGRTVTLKIDTDTTVAAQGATTNASSLEPGAEVEVKVKKDGQSARQIAAKQAHVEGTISKIESGNVTIQSEKGSLVTVLVTNSTRIEIEDEDNGTLADLKVGLKVEAKYDPTTKQAFKIELQENEENRGKGKETSEIGSGIVEIRVTDPPPANVKSAVVFLSNIEVHMAGKNKDDVSDNSSASGNETGTWIPVIGAPVSFDLMDVIGVDKVLGAANITAGKFTQIRMDVTKVEGVTTDNISFTAEVPGDKLKIVGSFNVGNGRKTVLTLDFDGEKSLIQTGEGRFLFKPVVKMLVNNQGKGNVDDRGESEKSENRGKPDTTGNATESRGKLESEGRGKGKD